MATNSVLGNEAPKTAIVANAGDTTYSSASNLAQALIRTATAHGRHEARIGKADPEWPEWYAEYMVREQSGEDLPQ